MSDSTVFILPAGKGSAAKGTTKGHLLKARDLKKYINQVSIRFSYQHFYNVWILVRDVIVSL
jgi:hypothetical protein